MSTTAEQPTASPRPVSYTADVMCDKFVQLRDKVAEIKKRHTEELSQYNLALNTLEAWMLEMLNTSGSDSMKTSNGTFFKTTHTSVTCNEWSKTLDYIRDNEAWELLEARVSRTAVESIMEETKAPIPGVIIRRATSLNVRRA